MGNEELKQLGYILYVVGFFVTFAVTAFYGFIAPWYKNPSGRYIFTLLLSLTLVLGNSVIRVFFRDWDYNYIIGVVLFAFYIVAIASVGVGIYNASVKRYLDIKLNKERQKK
jgi:hypothetical protein